MIESRLQKSPFDTVVEHLQKPDNQSYNPTLNRPYAFYSDGEGVEVVVPEEAFQQEEWLGIRAFLANISMGSIYVCAISPFTSMEDLHNDPFSAEIYDEVLSVMEKQQSLRLITAAESKINMFVSLHS